MTASSAARLSLSSTRAPFLGFCEQAAHFLVDDLLGALGIGSFLAERETGLLGGLGPIRSRWVRAGGTSPTPSPS